MDADVVKFANYMDDEISLFWDELHEMLNIVYRRPGAHVAFFLPIEDAQTLSKELQQLLDKVTNGR